MLNLSSQGGSLSFVGSKVILGQGNAASDTVVRRQNTTSKVSVREYMPSMYCTTRCGMENSGELESGADYYTMRYLS